MIAILWLVSRLSVTSASGRLQSVHRSVAGTVTVKKLILLLPRIKKLKPVFGWNRGFRRNDCPITLLNENTNRIFDTYSHYERVKEKVWFEFWSRLYLTLVWLLDCLTSCAFALAERRSKWRLWSAAEWSLEWAASCSRSTRTLTRSAASLCSNCCIRLACSPETPSESPSKAPGLRDSRINFVVSLNEELIINKMTNASKRVVDLPSILVLNVVESFLHFDIFFVNPIVSIFQLVSS